MLTPEQAIDAIARHAIEPAPVAIEVDRTTSYAIASGKELISETAFFRLLGVETIHAIDHSDFEGADIILDRNAPIPAELAASADFVYGGSVLDNVFDPAAYIRNISRLLHPGGRLIDSSVASFNQRPYVVVSPARYFGYFVLNTTPGSTAGSPIRIAGVVYWRSSG